MALILKSKTRKTRKYFQDINLKACVLFEKVGTFRGFRVFDIGPYTEIENSENSQIFPRHVNSKECTLLKKSKVSEISEFSISVLIMKSETQKTRQISIGLL